jgi:hypothetical protein
LYRTIFAIQPGPLRAFAAVGIPNRLAPTSRRDRPRRSSFAPVSQRRQRHLSRFEKSKRAFFATGKHQRTENK